MPMPKILVTAAAGKTGSALVAECLQRGWQVRAVVRQADARARDLATRGADVMVADLHDRAAMRHAVRGVGRAYWCAPFDPRALEAAQIFADAAEDAGIEAIVGLSQWLASPFHPALATRNAFATDRLFESLAPQIAYTALNPGFFADNYLRLIGFAAQLGVLPSLTGDSRNAPPSNEDIARVAAAVLADPEPHAGRTYRPTGPEVLSTADMAAILTTILRRKVRKVELPFWLFAKAARMQGVSPFELSGFRHYIEDHRQGAFARGAPNDVVERLTGRPPERFATVAARYAARPEAQRSAASVLRAWAEFMITPLMPGYDLTRFGRIDGAPQPAGLRHAMADTGWIATHGEAAIPAIGR
ncbi:NmrA family NAD(P)-binding protein [Erythrobacter colymbi]|uniref:NmrA family NAD(P)-binding protein n=1 Tax=Erythrobacter colymbi TaxID=1161202 RepID=UPI0013900745|nr:NmrA family NAD(P)-binding protein [Erythrobacter colymbi]